MLAISKNDCDKIDSLYELFINIINDSNIKNEIYNCNNYSSFIDKVLSIK